MRWFCLLLMLIPVSIRAAGTRTVVHGPEEFLEGELRGVILDANGEITPAAVFAETLEIDAFFAWSLVEDHDGRLVVGTGDGGRVFRERNGALEAWGETASLEVLCLLAQEDGVLCGTTPDAMVLHIADDGTVSTVLDLPQQSVWDMERVGADAWVAAVGPEASIVLVNEENPAGRELHALPAGNATRLLFADDVLWVGTDSPASVYRLDGDFSAPPRLVYEAPESEIRELVSGASGGVYALAVDFAASEGENGSSSSRVVWLAPDGSSEILHEGSERLMAMALAPGGGLLLADADEQLILHLDDRGRSSVWHAIDGSDPVSLLVREDGRVDVGTGNLASVVQLGPARDRQGHFVSSVISADGMEQWGRLRVEPSGEGIRFAVRSGVRATPDESWTDWGEDREVGDVADGVVGPYLQYRLELSDDASAGSVHLAYRERNQSPRVLHVRVEPAGGFLSLGSMSASPQPVSQRFDDGLSVEYSVNPAHRVAEPEASVWARGIRSIVFTAHDPNDDVLRYTIELRQLPEGPWIELVDDWDATVRAWDTRLHADGSYRIRVRAGDGLSNDPATARFNQRESAPVLVDNTAPEFRSIRWEEEGGWLSAEIEDASSPLSDLSWRVDDGPWRPANPEDGVLDGPKESLRFQPEIDGGRRVWLRAMDSAGNVELRAVDEAHDRRR